MHQHLVALAVNLQLAGGLVDSDPAAAKELLDELGRDVRQALDETLQLAQQLHPPLLGVGGLTSALRSAAASTGTRAAIEVPAGASYPAAIEWTVYLCCLEALAQAGAGAQATIVVREEEVGLAFEIAANAADANVELDRLRDRVEALGGRLTSRSEPGRGTRVSGSLPL